MSTTDTPATAEVPAAPKRAPRRHVLKVIDMSGSMFHLAEDVRSGFNSYIDGLRADTDYDYRVTATVFDTEFMPICVGAKLDKVPFLTHELYSPRGYTALCDAVAKTILEFEKRVPKLKKNDSVLLVVNTDGQENASREFTRSQVAEMIKAREATEKWACLFLGAGPDAWKQSIHLGFASANTVQTHDTHVGTQAVYTSLVGATRSYSRTGSADGATAIVAAACAGVADPDVVGDATGADSVA
jgi:hypothetical protein